MTRVFRGPILKLLLSLGLVLPLVGAPASPVAAEHGPMTGGSVNLLGLITFSKFPCASLGETTCIGLFKGSWYGGLSGLSSVNAETQYVANWRTDEKEGLTGGQRGTTTAALHSSFYSYDPICTPTAQAAGAAEGYARSGTGHAQAAGPDEITTGEATYLDGTTRKINSITMTFDYTFMRIGNGLTVTFTNVKLTAHPDGKPDIPMLDSPQVGDGSFVPEDPGYQTGLPGCDAPLQYMEARANIGMTINHPSDFMP